MALDFTPKNNRAFEFGNEITFIESRNSENNRAIKKADLIDLPLKAYRYGYDSNNVFYLI
jgi:hypothetical protein